MRTQGEWIDWARKMLNASYGVGQSVDRRLAYQMADEILIAISQSRERAIEEAAKLRTDNANLRELADLLEVAIKLPHELPDLEQRIDELRKLLPPPEPAKEHQHEWVDKNFGYILHCAKCGQIKP